MSELEIEQIATNPVINLALDTIKIGKQALCFVNTKQSAEKSAEEIAKKIKSQDPYLLELSEKIKKVLSRPTKQCERLARCVAKGTAFHHAGITAAQRKLIEDNFRDGKIKIICCTPTLAAGVDLPAFRSIIRDLKRFGNQGMAPIQVLEYLQMAGRAGRPKYDTQGQSIIVTQSEAEMEEVYEKYVLGAPEDIYSKLAVEPVLRTYVLSLIASDFVKNREELMDFFSQTFWAHQFKELEELEKKIAGIVEMLEFWGFIEGSKDDFVSAADMSDSSLKATPLGARVSQLYIDPYTANHLLTGLRKASSIDFNSLTMLQLVSQTLEMRPLLRPKVKEQDYYQEELLKVEGILLVEEPSVFDMDYDFFLSSFKTAYFFADWIEEKDEEYLLEEYSIRPGEIKSKLDTADWLIYSCEELSKISKLHNLAGKLSKLRYRVKNGVKEELIALLKLKGIGRVRARKLFRNDIKTIGDVKKADVQSLTQILGSGKLVVDIKDQLGQKVTQVPVKKRKGQLSLGKY